MNSELDAIVRRLYWRIVPLLAVLYIISYLDRVNVSFAALTMNADLGLSATAYGWGAGIFFLGYLLFQVPSNIMLERFGPKRWIATIMVAWGAVSVSMGFIRHAEDFMIARFLLGLAEAGFFPGIILYLTYWFPPAYRGRIISGFMFGVPIATVIGAPLSGYILQTFHGGGGFEGWRWLFIVEGAPAILGAVLVLWLLPDRPSTARWLPEAARTQLLDALAVNNDGGRAGNPLRTIFSLRIWRYALGYFGLALSLYGVGLWLPQLIKANGVTTTMAALLSAIPYIVAAVGMLIWGHIADKRQGAPASNVWIPALAVVAALGALPLVKGLTVELILLSVAAVGTLAALATFWTVPTSRLSKSEAPVGIATINSIGNLGGFLGPLMIGWIKDTTGSFQLGLWFLAAWAGVSVLLLAAEDLRRSRV